MVLMTDKPKKKKKKNLFSKGKIVMKKSVFIQIVTVEWFVFLMHLSNIVCIFTYLRRLSSGFRSHRHGFGR